MTAPAITSTRNLPGNGETLNARQVAREFARVLGAHGITPRPGLVRRLAHRFIADGFTRPADVDAYVLDYADPTGETAARNVDRDRAAATP